MNMSVVKIPKTCNGCKAHDEFAGGCALDYRELCEPCPKPLTNNKYIHLTMIRRNAITDGKNPSEVKSILLSAK